MVHRFIFRISEHFMITFFPHEVKSYLDKNFSPVIPVPSHLSISLNIKENLDCLRSRPRKKKKMIMVDGAKRVWLVSRKMQRQIFSRSICFFKKKKHTHKKQLFASTQILPLQGRKATAASGILKSCLLFFRDDRGHWKKVSVLGIFCLFF